MTTATQLRRGISEIGTALRRPEQFALRWRDRHLLSSAAPPRIVFPLLLANAILGIAALFLAAATAIAPLARREAAG